MHPEEYLDTAARAIHERAGARGRSKREVLQRQPKGPRGIAADGQPELRRVIGVRLGVARHQPLVVSSGVGAPELRLGPCFPRGENAGELGRVVRIVTLQRKPVQVSDCHGDPAFGGIDLGDATLRRHVGRQSANR